MRRSPRWLVTLPIALAASEAGHALGNVLAGAPHTELFESVDSGSGALPLVGFALLALVVAGVARSVEGRAPRVAALPFALLPPAGFLLIELGEALSTPGRFRLDGVAFALGLLFQLPAAVVGYAVARVLLRLGDEARALLLGLPSGSIVFLPTPARIVSPGGLPRRFLLAGLARGRAPPSAAAFPG